MHGKGHAGLTLTLLSPIVVVVGVFISLPVAIVFALGGIAGSGLPDLDIQTSLVKHRGFTHTVWFSIIAGICMTGIALLSFNQFDWSQVPLISQQIVIGGSVLFGFGTSFGVISHLLGDMITPMGIRPFDPTTPKGVLIPSLSDKKIVYEIANASNERLNDGSLALGIFATTVAFGILVQTKTAITII